MIFGPFLRAGGRVRAGRTARHLRAGSCGGRAVAEPILSLQGLRKNFRRPARHRRSVARCAAGRIACADRPERRRQDDADQSDFRSRFAGCRAHRVLRRRCHRLRAVRASEARPCTRSFQITSTLPNFSALENVALAVQARSGSSYRFVGDAAKETDLSSQAMSASTGSRACASRRHSGRASVAWRASRAGAGHCAGDAAEIAGAR